MANDLPGLSSALATALNDTSHEAWNSTEKDSLVTWAVADLYPRFARGLDPTASTITLVALTYFYALPTGVVEVDQVDRVTAAPASEEAGPLTQGTWTVVGNEWGTQKLRVAPIIVEQLGTLRLHGFGRYDLTTNLIPDHLVPMVLAMGRVEAYRRLTGERARFLQWQASNHEQDVTINELLALVQEAQAESERMRERLRRSHRHPVPGRRG